MALIAACTMMPGDYFAINSSPEAYAALIQAHPNFNVVDLPFFEEHIGIDLHGRTGGVVSLSAICRGQKKRRSLFENGGLECFGLEFKADAGNHGIAFAVIVGVFFGTFGVKVSTDEEQINIFVCGIDV